MPRANSSTNAPPLSVVACTMSREGGGSWFPVNCLQVIFSKVQGLLCLHCRHLHKQE